MTSPRSAHVTRRSASEVEIRRLPHRTVQILATPEDGSGPLSVVIARFAPGVAQGHVHWPGACEWKDFRSRWNRGSGPLRHRASNTTSRTTWTATWCLSAPFAQRQSLVATRISRLAWSPLESLPQSTTCIDGLTPRLAWQSAAPASRRSWTIGASHHTPPCGWCGWPLRTACPGRAFHSPGHGSSLKERRTCFHPARMAARSNPGMWSWHRPAFLSPPTLVRLS